jgi:hypothetical protein
MSVQDDPWHTCSYYSWCSIGVSITLHNARITLGIAVLCCDTSQMFGWCSSFTLFHRPIFLPLQSTSLTEICSLFLYRWKGNNWRKPKTSTAAFPLWGMS